VISLGPPTNLAAALASAPAIASRLRRVVLMGGEMTGGKMDLNFMSDRGAARAIFEAPVPKMIVPIQLCAQAAMTRARVDALEAACCPGAAACALVRKMALQTSVMPWLVNKHVRPKLPEAGSGHRDAGRWPASGGMEDGFIPWDVVAVLAALRPADLFERWQVHRMTMPRCGDGAEPCDGTMTVEPIDARHITKPLEAPRKFVGYHVPDERGHMLDATTSSDREIHRHVVTVPDLLRSEASLLDASAALLCLVPVADPAAPLPPLLLGFAAEALLAVGASVAALLGAALFRSERAKAKRLRDKRQRER